RPASAPPRPLPRLLPPSDPLYLLCAREDELEHLVDRRAHVRLGDHRHAVATGTSHDVVLHAADVVEALDVLLVRPQTVEARIAHHEVRAVLLLVLDRKHTLDDQRALD